MSEQSEQRMKRRAERQRKRREERKSTVSGLKCAVSAQGDYVYVNYWSAYFYYDKLAVYAVVSTNNSVQSVYLDVLPTGGGNPYVIAGSTPNQAQASVSLYASTDLVGTQPTTVLSTISGTVNTPNGPSSFYLYQTLYVAE